jgi:hypothetical protein
VAKDEKNADVYQPHNSKAFASYLYVQDHFEQRDNVKSTDDSVIFGAAGEFTAGEIEFHNIGPSVFYMDDGKLEYANVVSADNNNSFELGIRNIILDSGEQFEADKVFRKNWARFTHREG